ncbi:hypothetical protein GGR57DRAFT_464974 [Xylariaceae sp. FL1272]|nr:hypothetical protein GGR57DRAFT_464974 [Xylariaceae sp. FL1272]
MVELDRVSHRTIHGHFRYANPNVSKRHYPLALRADVNRSTPILPRPGPIPSLHRAPYPPPVRPRSAASNASRNHSLRDRPDNASLRTASLTSNVSVYSRLPSVPRPTTGDSQTAPPPLYYDYTEDFESNPPQVAAPTLSPASLRARHKKVQQDAADNGANDDHASEHLATVFGEGDSAFFDGESQFADEQSAPRAHSRPASHQSDHQYVNSSPAFHSRHNSGLSRQRATGERVLDTRNTNVRGSDIDLLPSQVTRDPTGIFNQSFEVESRDVSAPYNYAACPANNIVARARKKKSPERQVQMSEGCTPTIRSQHGIILRSTSHDGTSGRETRESFCSSTNPTTILPRTPGSVCVEENDRKDPESSPSQQEEPMYPVDTQDQSPTETSRSPQCSQSLSSPDVTSFEEIKGEENYNEGPCSPIEVSHSGNDQTFRRHRRHHAALRISTTNLPRDDNEGYPHIRPSCSTAPLISPKPISPARQLKVKNSIPRLMKALPPVPNDAKFNTLMTTVDLPEEDDFVEILAPFRFPESNEPRPMDLSTPFSPNPIAHANIGRVSHNDGPKFRLKIRTTDDPEATNIAVSKQPWTRANLSHSDRVSGFESGNEDTSKEVRPGSRNKLKLRSSRPSRSSSPYSSTVRRNKGIEATHVISDLLQHQSRDLFNASPKTEPALLRKPRKFVSHSSDPHTLTASSSLDDRISSASRLPSTLSSRREGQFARLSDDGPSSQRASVLKRHLSNLRVFLSPTTNQTGKSAGADTTNMVISAISDAKISKETSSSTNDASKIGDALSTKTKRLRLGQRIRAKLFRLIKGTRTGKRQRANNMFLDNN